MELVYVQYAKAHNTPARYFYMLPLSEEGDKVVGLRTREGPEAIISDGEVALIRKESAYLDTLSGEGRLEWAANNLPSFKRAFITIHKSQIVVALDYEVKADG